MAHRKHSHGPGPGSGRLCWIPIVCALACCSGGKSADKRAQPARGEQAKPETKYGLTQQQAAQVLVSIGDKRITLGEFADRLGNQSPYLRARYNSPERRREFLDNMVRFELLAREAEKRGYDKSEEVATVRKQSMVQQMMQDLFETGGIKLSDVGDQEIKAYYDAHPAEFDKPAQLRASHILFKDRAAADKALQQLKADPKDIELFRKLAAEHSQDAATKTSGGDLRFFSATRDASGESDSIERPEALRRAAFSLKEIGDLYPEPVQSERGFHVVKLTGRREALKRSLEDSRRMIQNKLWREKREAAIEKFVSDLRSKADVQENADALAKVRVKDAMGQSAELPAEGSGAKPASSPAAKAKTQ